MAATLSREVLQDDAAVSIARVLAAANKSARQAGVDVSKSLITITQRFSGEGMTWRVNYGMKNYIGRRGGDVIVEIDSHDASVKHILRGQ